MYKFSIVTNIGILGETEDGRPYKGEILSIMAERQYDGSRWSHSAEFPCASTNWSEDGEYYVRISIVEACKHAEKLLNEIKECNILTDLDPEYWTEVAPVFGSSAYRSLKLETQEEI